MKEGVFAVLWQVEDVLQGFDLVLILFWQLVYSSVGTLKLRKLLLEERRATPVTSRVDISVFLSSAGLVGREEGGLEVGKGPARVWPRGSVEGIQRLTRAVSDGDQARRR